MSTREKYFSIESLATQAAEMYRTLQELGLIKKQLFVPENSALLVLDMQKIFAQPESHAFIPSFPAIVPGILRLIDTYVSQNLTIIYTQHLNNRKDAGLMAIWWRNLVTISDPLGELIPELDTSKGQLFQKSRYDAFLGTGLEKFLIDRGINQVVICGVMTHLCCETTARSAFMHDFEVFFTLDGTATYNRRHHMASALNLAHGFAVPVLIDQMIEKIGLNSPL
jgi:bifunctional isochorismate lyase/aryl carrier protein